MATTYTSKLALGKPAVSDKGWDVPLNANCDALDALAPLSGLAVIPTEIPSTSLNVKVAAGSYQKADGTVATYAGTSSQAVAASSTKVLYLDSSGTLQVGSSYPGTTHTRLATVVTGTGSITSITDNRIVCSVVGSDARPFLPLAGGTLGEGANLVLGTTTGSKIGTSSSQKLGFWGATAIVRPSAYTQTYSTSIKTLSAYTANVESTTFTGIDNAQTSTPYAQVADLESLRAAYENLRALTENTAKVLNSVIDDLQAFGLLG